MILLFPIFQPEEDLEKSGFVQSKGWRKVGITVYSSQVRILTGQYRRDREKPVSQYLPEP